MTVSTIRSAVSQALVEGKVPNYITGEEMTAILGKAGKAWWGLSGDLAAADAKELKSLHESARLTFRSDEFEPAKPFEKPTLSYTASLRLWKALQYRASVGPLANKPTVDTLR